MLKASRLLTFFFVRRIHRSARGEQPHTPVVHTASRMRQAGTRKDNTGEMLQYMVPFVARIAVPFVARIAR